MRRPRKKIFIGVCAFASVAILFATPSEKQRVATVSEAQAFTPLSSSAAAHRSMVMNLRRDGLGAQRGEPFASSSPVPQPAAPMSFIAPDKPVLPRIPYRFAGTMLYDGELRSLITDGNEIYEAKASALLGGMYRIESADAESVVVLHVPSGTTTRLVPSLASSAPEPERPRTITFDAAASAARSDP
jgi:hypothetical protein